MRAYIVERDALIHNIQTLRRFAGDIPIWGVLKGNGYGIGLLPLARLLSENGVERFAVTELKEAEQLREGGFTENPILMLRSTADPAEINALLDLHVILTVGSYETAVAINAIAGSRADIAEVHLAVDTGMGRYGFLPEETDKIISLYEYMKNLAVSGIYTHFHSAFCSSRATKRQFALFQSVVDKLQNAGYETGMIHCCNSAAFLRFPQMHCDAVRLGSVLLGRVGVSTRLNLKRVGYAEATVDELRTIPKGHTMGYGAGWKAREQTRIAVVELGWYNGFAAERQNDLYRVRDSLRGILHHVKDIFLRRNLIVTVNGHKCRVLGHVGMVNMVVDVTDIDCSLGDKVVAQINPLLVKGLKIQYR